MSETVNASNGDPLPISSLRQTIVYDGSFVSTITVVYGGFTYIQTFTNNGTKVTEISQWVKQ